MRACCRAVSPRSSISTSRRSCLPIISRSSCRRRWLALPSAERFCVCFRPRHPPSMCPAPFAESSSLSLQERSHASAAYHGSSIDPGRLRGAAAGRPRCASKAASWPTPLVVCCRLEARGLTSRTSRRGGRRRAARTRGARRRRARAGRTRAPRRARACGSRRSAWRTTR